MGTVILRYFRCLTGFHMLVVERDEGGADAASKSFGMTIDPGIETAKLSGIKNIARQNHWSRG